MAGIDTAAFRRDLEREGYEISEGRLEPAQRRGEHTHDFDARLLVLEGHLTLHTPEGQHTYGPGESCALAAGTPHAEEPGPDGVRYLLGRRAATPSSGP